MFGSENFYMLRILIIRPGATVYDTERCIQGNLSISLTEEGRAEVHQLADELASEQINMLYCSPCEPALETAELLARALAVPRKRLDHLVNYNHGLWQGMRVADLRKCQPRIYRLWSETPERVCPPGGEMYYEVLDRIRSSIRLILQRHKSGTVGVVVGEPLASLMSSYLKSEEVQNLWNAIGEHGNWEPVEVNLNPAVLLG